MNINCICFINLLAGHYRIYWALVQGVMEKKWSIIKKNGVKFLHVHLSFVSFVFDLKNILFKNG